MLPIIFVFYEFLKRLKKIFSNPELKGTFIFVAILLLSGMLFYHRVEGWSLLDALYFCVVTLTTIGYGDLAPKTGFGKLFTIFYIFLGLGTLAVFISTIAQETVEWEGLGFLRREKAGDTRKEGPSPN